MTKDALVRENAELRRQLAKRDTLIEQLRAELSALREQVAALKEELGKSSRNSSKPPSSDGPAAPLRKRKRPTGRKPGGQPGHERHERELVPIDKVSKVIECIPGCCEQCGKGLHGKDPTPERHQVTELPKVEPGDRRVSLALAALLVRPYDARQAARWRSHRRIRPVRGGDRSHDADRDVCSR